MNTPLAKWVLATSDRVYRLLLAVYPPAFRRAYGPHMAQVFRDCCRDALRRDGVPGLIRLWARTLGDLVTTAFKERLSASAAPASAAPAQIVEGSRTMFWDDNRVFGKFTKRAKQSFQLATEEARTFNHPYIGTEHILLGLIREEGGVAGHVLRNLGLTLDQARRAVEFIVGVGDTTRQDQGLSTRAQKVLGYAAEEADRLQHHYVGTEHLLLGVVRLGEGTAAGVLDCLEVSLEQVRAEVLRMLHRDG